MGPTSILWVPHLHYGSHIYTVGPTVWVTHPQYGSNTYTVVPTVWLPHQQYGSNTYTVDSYSLGPTLILWVSHLHYGSHRHTHIQLTRLRICRCRFSNSRDTGSRRRCSVDVVLWMSWLRVREGDTPPCVDWIPDWREAECRRRRNQFRGQGQRCSLDCCRRTSVSKVKS